MKIGTRTRQIGLLTVRAEQENDTRVIARDPLMTRNVRATVTFTAGSARVTGSNNLFTAFAVNDAILVQGCNKNNGTFLVAGVDVANRAYLTLTPPPKDEASVLAAIRAA